MTKEFKRDNLLFSLCGLNCSLCPMFVTKKCAGCIEGSMCYNICDIAPCSIEHHGVDYCFEWEEYPCKKYDGINQHDSVMTHINQLIDMEKAKNMGVEKYNQQQRQKVQILHEFLENYNYGNDNELFFCTAVNLLPLTDLFEIIENVEKYTINMALKEKYGYLNHKLFEYANNSNINIELRKSKYNKAKIIFF